MTALDRKLAEIAGRADAATDGPWAYGYWGKFGKDDEFVRTGWSQIASESKPINVAGMIDYEEGGICEKHDATFIAHARTDVPALLRLVAVLREQLGVARLFVHRDWCFVNDCSNETPCRDYFDGIERSDAAALAALEGE